VKLRLALQAGWRDITVHYGNNGSTLNVTTQGLVLGGRTDSDRDHGAVSLHLLPRLGARHGDESGRNPGDWRPRAVRRRFPIRDGKVTALLEKAKCVRRKPAHGLFGELTARLLLRLRLSDHLHKHAPCVLRARHLPRKIDSGTLHPLVRFQSKVKAHTINGSHGRLRRVDLCS
jgi:hypothetical protein